MGDDDEGDAALPVELEQEVLDHRAGGRVEVARGLVGEDHGGVVDQGPGDRDPLLLPARQVGGTAGGLLRHVQALEHVQGTAPARSGADPGDAQRQHHVLQDGLVRGQVELLEHEPERGVARLVELTGRHRRRRPAVQGHRAAGGRVEQREKVHQGRLARAGLPDDGDGLPVPDAQVHAPQRGETGVPPAVDLDQVLGLEHRGRHRIPPVGATVPPDGRRGTTSLPHHVRKRMTTATRSVSPLVLSRDPHGPGRPVRTPPADR